MKEQLMMLIEIIIRPRQALKSLPSDQFYIVSFLVSAYFTFSSLLRNGTYQQISFVLNFQIISFVVTIILIGIVFVITALITKGILAIFRKRLTLNKIMNIIGYSQTPRLLLSLPSSIILDLLPESSRVEVVNSMSNGGVFTVTFIILGFVLLIYSLFLLIWGFVLSESA